MDEMQFFGRWRELYTENAALRRIQHRKESSEWRKSNPERFRAQLRKSYHIHAEKRRLGAKESRARLKQDPTKLRAHYDRLKLRRQQRHSEDIDYHLRIRIRNRVKMAVNSNYRNGSGLALLGCSITEYRMYLEGLFKPGMTWDNYGRYGWHIDHKTPCSSFDLSDPEQQKICFHYSNTQPMWYLENLSKGSKT